MIRFSKEADYASIISLWNEAFGDKEEDICFFLKNKFIPQNTIVFEEDDKISSMLFLLDGELILNGKSFPSYYLYAACTAKSQRGRGIMANLLQKAKEITAERNKYFICLMPGEPSLFDFYERFGYKSIFSRKILYINRSELISGFSENLSINSEALAEKRRNAFESFNRFDWDENAVRFAFEHHKLYNGSVCSYCKGYALYTTDESSLNVKEFAFQPCSFISVITQLFDKTKSDGMIIYLPSDYPTNIGKYEIKKSAMALAAKEEYNRFIGGIENAYLGLTLD